jgi:hypothetical protein
MGLLASLLFGRDAERLFDLVTGESSREREMADQVARSREWCGSTPARGRAARDFGGAGQSRRPAFPFDRFDDRLTRYVRGMSGVLRGYA